jgi:hypothetical protein
MPRRELPWFRLYTETFGDPKIRRMTPGERWAWLGLLSLARASTISGFVLVAGEGATEADIADYAGVPIKDVRSMLHRMEVAESIERDPNLDAWRITNWGKRQFESDAVVDRTRKHRGRNVPTDDVGTTLERSNVRGRNGIGTSPENRDQRTEALGRSLNDLPTPDSGSGSVGGSASDIEDLVKAEMEAVDVTLIRKDPKVYEAGIRRRIERERSVAS